MLRYIRAVGNPILTFNHRLRSRKDLPIKSSEPKKIMASVQCRKCVEINFQKGGIMVIAHFPDARMWLIQNRQEYSRACGMCLAKASAVYCEIGTDESSGPQMLYFSSLLIISMHKVAILELWCDWSI